MEIFNGLPSDLAPLDVPAVHVNVMQTVRMDDLVRVSFGEAFPGLPPKYRFAVVMRSQDARSFANSLMGIATENIAAAPMVKGSYDS